MGIINRLFVFVYALAVGILLALVATAAFGVVPEREWLSEIRYWFGRQEFYTVLGVLSLFSLYFILYALLVKTPEVGTDTAEDEFILVQGKGGEVKVATEAVKALAVREAELANAVRSAVAEVRREKKEDGAGFRLELSLIVLVGVGVAEISAEVTELIRRQFAKTFGIDDMPLDIKVQEITNAPVENKKRVV